MNPGLTNERSFLSSPVLFSYLSGGILGGLEQNADSEVHERLGEVYHSFTGVINRHGGHGDVGSEKWKMKRGMKGFSFSW